MGKGNGEGEEEEENQMLGLMGRRGRTPPGGSRNQREGIVKQQENLEEEKGRQMTPPDAHRPTGQLPEEKEEEVEGRKEKVAEELEEEEGGRK
jgi:hypothetical protein